MMQICHHTKEQKKVSRNLEEKKANNQQATSLCRRGKRLRQPAEAVLSLFSPHTQEEDSNMHAAESFQHLQTANEATILVSTFAGADDSLSKEAATLFAIVWKIAIFNVLFSVLRPDPYISWSLKIPRVLWELSIASLTKSTVSTAVDPLSPLSSRFVLIAMMLIPTALLDIFLWSPVFAAMVEFKSCQGGWFTGQPYQCHVDPMKGYGRLAVVVQSLFGGLLYLFAGISSLNFHSNQLHRQRLAREVLLKRQLEPPTLPPRSFPYSLGLGQYRPVDEKSMPNEF